MKPSTLKNPNEIPADLIDAVKLHEAGKKKEALNRYLELLKKREPPLAAFLNSASILRADEKLQQARKILKRAITLYPQNPGPWNNLGNCFLDDEMLTSAVISYRNALEIDPTLLDARISLSSCLRKLGHSHLSYAVILMAYKYAKDSSQTNRISLPLVESLLSLPEETRGASATLHQLTEQIEQDILSNSPQDDPAKGGFTLAHMWMNLGQMDRAIACRDQVIKETENFLRKKEGMKLRKQFQESWHMLSWNLAINLLKQGRLSEGWRLYEHGLQVPASGAQRWQRSLKKPFRPSEVPFWKGQSLRDKRLLLLGEQGIGDSMMFATLIPRLQEEGAEIFLFPGDRLLEIYKRSLTNVPIISHKDLKEGKFKSTDFDLQVPIGSICQYRFTNLNDYCPRSPFLKANASQVSELRNKYSDGRPLIGLSWQGGGKANRIKMKSIGLKQLAPLLQRKEFNFVSLQYGDDGPHLERFQKSTGINVLHDDDINPLKDMDGWLSQVGAMDGVLSIANTTVHGSGGLGIPTMCLVSNKSDWRWIEPEIYQGNYWYSSVDATYQTKDGNWSQALSSADGWLTNQLSKHTN